MLHDFEMQKLTHPGRVLIRCHALMVMRCACRCATYGTCLRPDDAHGDALKHVATETDELLGFLRWTRRSRTRRAAADRVTRSLAEALVSQCARTAHATTATPLPLNFTEKLPRNVCARLSNVVT